MDQTTRLAEAEARIEKLEHLVKTLLDYFAAIGEAVEVKTGQPAQLRRPPQLAVVR